MFQRIDHLGIAVESLDAELKRYADLGQSEFGKVVVVEDQKVRVGMVKVGGSALELLEPTAPDSPVAKFLASRGPGVHHVAYRVSDIEATMAELKRHGKRLLAEHWHLGYAGAKVCFVHPKDCGGILTELVERPPEVSQEPPFTC